MHPSIASFQRILASQLQLRAFKNISIYNWF